MARPSCTLKLRATTENAAARVRAIADTRSHSPARNNRVAVSVLASATYIKPTAGSVRIAAPTPPRTLRGLVMHDSQNFSVSGSGTMLSSSPALAGVPVPAAVSTAVASCLASRVPRSSPRPLAGSDQRGDQTGAQRAAACVVLVKPPDDLHQRQRARQPWIEIDRREQGGPRNGGSDRSPR